jgi:non-heme chloroperoxidase
MDTYADDLAAVIDALDLRHATLVGFSTGGGEVARYVGRHGTGRVAQVVLVSAVPPFMLESVPVAIFDGLRAGSLADRSQLYHDLADGPFFGNNRPGATVSQGIRDAFWLQSMAAGEASAARIKNARLIVYPGAPHGLTDTHKEQLGNDLLDFLSGKDA